MRKKLEELVVGDRVEMAANTSNGHDFNFDLFTIKKITEARDLFGSPCLDLNFDKGRSERFNLPCQYSFDVPEEIS